MANLSQYMIAMETRYIHKVGNFEVPMCIAIDASDGSVYVADYGANSVLKYTDI